jgi:putative ABC transport system permease protein
MDILTVFRIALFALARNKMRSLLTMLGIVIGVGAVIANVAIGQGAEQKMQSEIKNFGTNTIFVAAGSPTRRHGGVRRGGGSVKTLIDADRVAILQQVPLVRRCAPIASSGGQVVYRNQNWATRMTGTTEDYFQVRNFTLQSGTMFGEEEVRTAQNVAVIGPTVSDILFPDSDPIGKTIRIQNQPFTVIGLTAPKGQSAMGSDQDDIVFMPFITLQKKISGQDWLNYISCEAESREASAPAQAAIESLLRERHRIQGGAENDFFVRTQSEFADLAQQTTQLMTMLLGSIASISLLVGGIGIMNIMLVSVTERTREIGIRLAVGATDRDIQRQFLVEAITLSLMGGAVGILVGAGASGLITKLAGWPVHISVLSMVAAVLFSAAVGIFFGFYPARKAAQLDPIEALRYE